MSCSPVVNISSFTLAVGSRQNRLAGAGPAVLEALLFHSVAISGCLEDTLKGQSHSSRLHLDAFARRRYFVATIVRLLEIKAEFVLLDRPCANFLRSH